MKTASLFIPTVDKLWHLLRHQFQSRLDCYHHVIVVHFETLLWTVHVHTVVASVIQVHRHRAVYVHGHTVVQVHGHRWWGKGLRCPYVDAKGVNGQGNGDVYHSPADWVWGSAVSSPGRFQVEPWLQTTRLGVYPITYFWNSELAYLLTYVCTCVH